MTKSGIENTVKETSSQESRQNSFKYLFIVFSIILIVFGALVLKLKYLSNRDQNTNIKSEKYPAPQDYWEIYENKDFGYKLFIPKNLEREELDGKGRYLHFVLFKESERSLGRGLAIGVNEVAWETEVEKLKEEMSKDENAIFVKEETISLSKLEGVKLYYRPKNKEEGEDRVIAVVSNSKYSYSISSVPEEIDLLLETFTVEE